MPPSETPDVTVIIPTYDRLWSLPKAIESCRATRCSVQIIVVDDGSRDGTREWLAAQDGLTVVLQPNLGKGWAVAAGMPHARGRYIKFLDSDDAVAPGAIDRQLAVAETTGADLVFSGLELVDERGETIERRALVAHDDFIALQLGEGDGSHYSAFLFRRELVADLPHRPEYAALDDRMFILEVALRHPHVASDAEPALLHTVHDREKMQGYHGMGAVVANHARVQLFRRILQRLQDAGELTPRRRRAVAPQLWWLAHWIAYTHPDEARDVADWARSLAPDCEPPIGGAAGLAYRLLGFRWTEALFRIRRVALRPFRRTARPRRQTFPT